MKIHTAFLGTAAGLAIVIAAPSFAGKPHHVTSAEQQETAQLNQQSLHGLQSFSGSAAGTQQRVGNGEVESVSNEPGTHYGSMSSTTVAPANGTANIHNASYTDQQGGGYGSDSNAPVSDTPASTDTAQPVHHHHHHRAAPASQPSNENDNGGNGIGSANGEPPTNGTTPETTPNPH